jgi:inner membrane protein
MRFPVLAKAASLGLVLGFLLLALGQVSGIVAERQERLREAQRSVADSLATSQSVVGPVLQRDCIERWETDKSDGKQTVQVTRERAFSVRSLPQTLQVDAESRTDPRYRGIFRVSGYVAKLRLAGDWIGTPSLSPQPEQPGGRLTCGPVFIWTGVSDARGIRVARISVDGEDAAVAPGVALAGEAQTFQSMLPNAERAAGRGVRVAVELELAGTEDLAFVPIGGATSVRLKSNWPHPSFNGRFLPGEREITSDGFTAVWQVSALATRAPQQILASPRLCRPLSGAAMHGTPDGAHCAESFGVSFIDPVSPYVLSDRATKYGVLFIVLTLVAVGLVEVVRRLRVHPIQYLLVGSALAAFFLLLVSLSEHLPFGWAYLVAASACTALLAFYGVHVLRGTLPGLKFGAGIALLFGTLYVLLLQEQTALAIGSILIFAVLATVMVITRRIDWYGLMGQVRSEARSGTG